MPDDIVIRFSVRDDGTPTIERVNEKIKTTGKESASLGDKFKSAWQGAKGLITSVTAITAAVGGTITALKGAYDAFQGYAQQVRDLASVSGTGAEEASKLLQVLDDYQISAEDVTTSMRAMTNAGLVPTVETLAQLSDQYLAIEDPMLRNEFVIKNLGRAGLQWVNVLKQGSAALRESEKEINKNLILSDEQIKSAEEQRLAMDALSDSWEGFKVSVGAAIGEVILVTKANTGLRKELKELYGMNEFEYFMVTAAGAGSDLSKTIAATARQMQRGAAATEFYQKQLQGMSETAEGEAVPAIEDLTEQYQAWLDLLGSITDEEKNHEDTLADLQASYEAEAATLAELTKTRWWDAEAIEEQKAKMADLQNQMEEETSKFEENTRRRVLSMLEERLAMDGLSEAEMRYLEGLGLQWGIYTESAVESAQAVRAEVESLAAQFESLPSEKWITIRLAGVADARASIASLSEANPDRTYQVGGYSQGTEGWMTVPAGYSNDTYPIMLSSGEKFAVIPQNKTAAPTASPAGDGMAIVPILKQFADEIARANRAAFEKSGRR